MKRLTALAAAVLMLFTSAYAERLTITYSGITKPDSLISFMAVKSGADLENLSADDLKRVEVVRADKSGAYRAEIKLDDAERDEEGRITNYTLHSNIDGVDINSGAISGEVVLKAGEFSVDKDGIVFVPLTETMKKFGITMTETSDGVFCGRGNNGDMEIVIGKDTAEVDWVDIELPAPSKYEDGKAMIPAYLLEDALRTEPPVYDEKSGCLYIQEPKPADAEDTFDIAEAVLGLRDKIEEERQILLNGSYTNDAKNVTIEVKTDEDGDGNTEDDARYTTAADPYGNIPALYARQAIANTKNMELPKGRVGLVAFDARASRITDESGVATISVSWQRRNGDYNSVCYEEVNVTDQWQRFYIPCYNAYYDINGDQNPALLFNIGGKPMTISIANVDIVRYDSSVELSALKPETGKPYHGIETKETYGYDALWRKEAYRRIEKYRKDDTDIKVTDKNGNPIENAKIGINQTENDFMFGLSVVKDEILEIDESKSPGNIQSDVVNNSFNTMVCGLEMKPRYISEDGGIDGIEMSNEFFKRHKRMRGHALMWDSEEVWPFDDYKSMSYEQLYRKIMDYVRPTAYAYRGKLEQWDVLNEPHDSNWIRTRYGTRLYSDVFKEVHKIDPDVKLYVNETGIEGKESKKTQDRIPRLLEIVRQMQSEGAPIDGIGIQAHCANYLYPQGFYQQLTECASAVDEVAVTEYDFRNADNTYAAEHLRDTLLATFSQPKATAFVIWGFQDSMHWRNSAPFYDSSWNEKPAKKMWDSMVNDEFKTRTDLVSDSGGNAKFRGFYGDYDITAEVGGVKKTFSYSLLKNAENKITLVFDGSNLEVRTSAKPKGDITPIKYKSVDEARKELSESEPFKYDGVVLEESLKGVAADSAVINGGAAEENTAYKNGEAWASTAGVKDKTADSADGMIILAKRYSDMDLRHKIKGSVLGGDAEFGCTFDTYSSDSDFRTDLFADCTDDYTLGSIACGSDGYYILCRDGRKLSIDKNSRYELKIIIHDGTDIKYELYKDDVFADSAEVLNNETLPVTKIQGIAFKMSSAADSGENLLKIVNARVKFTLYSPIIKFDELGYEHKALDEDMKDFDLKKTTFTTDDLYKSGEAWGRTEDKLEKGFAYKTYQKYLWAIRASDRKAYSLKHKFTAPTSEETLTLELDSSLYALSWYNGSGRAGINLCGNDGTKIPVICTTYNQYGYKGAFGSNYDVGFVLRMLNTDGNETDSVLPVYSGAKNSLNRNNLHIKLTLTPNGSGGRDAKLVMTNQNGNTYTAEKERFITESAAECLDTIEFYSQTDALGEGKNLGASVMGVKNTVIYKEGREKPQKINDEYRFAPGAAVGIDYKNITEKPFEAVVIVSGYTDETVTETYLKSFSESGAASGSLSIKLPNGGADYYKLFVLDGAKNLRPYTKSDIIRIN